jgi:hypothetical protein
VDYDPAQVSRRRCHRDCAGRDGDEREEAEMINLYDENHHFLGAVQYEKFVFISTIAEAAIKYPSARFALSISDDNVKEFHVYKIERGDKFLVECIL